MSVFYWLVAASIAELASAMPSAGGGSSAEVLSSTTLFSTLKGFPADSSSQCITGPQSQGAGMDVSAVGLLAGGTS